MNTVKRAYSQIEKYGDHPLVEAIAGEIPVFGGLVSYWRGMIAARRERELDSLLFEIQSDLLQVHDELATKIDVEHLRTADFQETLAAIVEHSIRDASDTKREYLKQFVINYALRERPSKIYKDIFFQLIEELNSLHINLLVLLYLNQHQLSEQDLNILLDQPHRREAITHNEIVKKLKVDQRLIRTVILQMSSRGLIQLSTNSVFEATDDTIVILTPLGKMFIAFLKGEWAIH